MDANMRNTLRAEGLTMGRGLVMALLASLTLAIFPRLGEMEGWLFPVVSDFTITTVTQTADGRVSICGTYDKYRSCPSSVITWTHVGADGHRQRVMLQDRGGRVPSKPLGRQSTCTMPWVLSLPWEQRNGRLIGVSTHACHPVFDTEHTWFDGAFPMGDGAQE